VTTAGAARQPPAAAGARPPVAAGVRQESLESRIAALGNPAADAAARELAALQQRSEQLLRSRSGHEDPEEQGAGRGTLVAGIARLRQHIDELDSAGLDRGVLDEVKKGLYLAVNDLSPYYGQGRNIDILETEKATRTCNITSLSMALESLGKGVSDYKGDRGKIQVVARVFRVVAPKVARADPTVRGGGDFWEQMRGLRLPDFMELAVVAEKLGSATASDEQVKTAATRAWGAIVDRNFLKTLPFVFGAACELKSFTLDPSKSRKEQQAEVRSFAEQAGRYRGPVEELVDARNKWEAAGMKHDKLERHYQELRAKLGGTPGGAMEQTLPLESYKAAIKAQVGPELEQGSAVVVNLHNHYVRLQAIHEHDVVVDDPARVGRANRKVTWEEARAMGYFKYRLVITGGGTRGR
jgi:hypothetical protein